MRSTIPLGRVARIPVGMHWSALIGMVLLGQLVALTMLPSTAPGLSAAAYWLAGGLAALGLGGSLLTHELAHAIVARRAGLGVRRITLWLLGGVSELVGQPSEPRAEVRIALVGPLTSLGLGGLFSAATVAAHGLAVPTAVVPTLSWLASMNILLGVFNLLPGTPLDGGRVLHGLLWRHTGDRERATRAAATSGQVLGALLAGTGVLLALHGRLDGLWLLLVGWFLSGSASAERAATIVAERLAGLRVADVMSAPPAVASGWWTVQAFIDRLLNEPGRRYREFPVVDIDGRLAGVVSIADLTRCSPAERRNVPVRQLARPLADELVLSPDLPLEQVLQRAPILGGALAAVVADGHVAGVLTSTDIARAVEIRTLHSEKSQL
ncbi:MAG TPA: site-2 protease family protein [Pseudonocardiaceae bacterium]|nr:site-2 protease family protein [Pseudonocardiaceae bacterium]